MSLEAVRLAYKDGRVDVPLRNVSEDYRPEGFIAERVLTPLSVPFYSGRLGSYGNSHLRLITTRVYDRGKYTIVPTYDYSLSTTYDLDVHGVGDTVSKRDRAEIQDPFEVESDVTMGLTNLLLNEKEYACSQLLRNTGSYESGMTETLSGTAQFNDYSNSDPIGKIKNAVVKIWSQSGMPCTTMILGYDVLETIRSHTKLANFYGQTGVKVQISEEQIKNAFSIPEIITAKAHYVNNSDTQTTFWGKDIILMARAPTPMRHQRTYGYYLTRDGEERNIYRNPIYNPPGGTEILADMTYQFLITHKACGYLIKNAIA